MVRALAAAGLGVALTLAAATFDTPSLYVPGLVLAVVSLGALVWVSLAAHGARVVRAAGPPTVEEESIWPLAVELRGGLLPPPGGELNEPLLGWPVPLARRRSRRLRINIRFSRRGRRVLAPATLTIRDPLRLYVREVQGEGGEELIVLPRIEPVLAAGGGGAGRSSLPGGEHHGAGYRIHDLAAELELDALRPYREGTPASRIHWPAVARTGELVERRLVADADSAPLVVLDASRPSSEEALDQAVRAASSLCFHLAREGGCSLLLPGDRRPTQLAPDLSAWPASHIRLALVEAGASRPSLSRARRAGALVWVTADPLRAAQGPRAGGRRLFLARLAPPAARGPGGIHGVGVYRPPAGRAATRAEGGMSTATAPARDAMRLEQPLDVPSASRDSAWVRLACFAALAAWSAAHWAGLVVDAELARTVGGVAVAVGGATLLLLLARSSLAAPLRHGLAAGVGALTVAVGLVVAGLPANLLKPARWDELGDGLDRGLSGIRTVEWPYAGDDDWVRLVILFGAPLLLGLAATLSFWPARRTSAVLRAVGLVLLLVLYGVAVTEHDPGEPLLRGLVLLALVAAWLWLPRLRPREAAPGAALVLVLGLAALPVAAKLDSDRPWWDYKEWNWFGGGKLVTFDWTHSYGPLDWPREGTTLLQIKADRGQYWKTESLDRFDGFRWLRSDRNELDTTAAELPDALDDRWRERIDVTVRALRSDLIVGVGTTLYVVGIDGVATAGDGTSRLLDGPLERGDSYSVRAYAPNPSAAEMREAGFDYDLNQVQYTEIFLPEPGESALEGSGLDIDASRTEAIGRDSVSLSLRGSPGTGTSGARAALLESSYARMYRLARRVTGGAPTIYEAVKRVERYLQESYLYDESVPNRKLPLAAFLFKDQRGYCQQFSGAMALMLRMAGIPARVSTGFAPGSLNSDTGEWRVRDLDAHSWVEVSFPEIGWVPFDPTPPVAPAESQSGGAEATSAARGDALEALRANRTPATDPGLAPAVGGGEDGGRLGLWVLPLALAGGALAWVALLVANDRRQRRGLAPRERVDVQLRELERALRRLGWQLPNGTTLLGLERRLARAAGPAAAGYVAGLRAHRFSPATPPAPGRGERSALRRELTAHRGVLARIRGYLALPPFLGPV